VLALDKNFRVWFAQHSIDLNILKNEDQLRSFLNQRDPLLKK